jgi:hypothetical protein
LPDEVESAHWASEQIQPFVQLQQQLSALLQAIHRSIHEANKNEEVGRSLMQEKQSLTNKLTEAQEKSEQKLIEGISYTTVFNTLQYTTLILTCFVCVCAYRARRI